jgi:hypothetical protein
LAIETPRAADLYAFTRCNRFGHLVDKVSNSNINPIGRPVPESVGEPFDDFGSGHKQRSKDHAAMPQKQ